MRRLRSTVPKLVVVALVPFLMGTDGCERSPAMSAVLELVRMVQDLDVRVSELEACDCEGILAPVCGANGFAYINRCEARCADVRIVSHGHCGGEVCGGPQGIECDEGAYCELPPGCDDPTGVGTCQDRPTNCTEEYSPVCGCDGVTYDNDCFRRAAGVALDHRGECRVPPVSCEQNRDCDRGQYCAKPEGACDARGECVERPQVCPDVWDPVCGCDRQTYGNSCEVAAAGVSVAHLGECRPPLCTSDRECGDGEFCEFERCPGIGIDLARPGECVPVPNGCPEILDPVCGCDGVTYDNDCFRREARVSKAHDGRCEEEPPRCGGIAGFMCPEPVQVCIYEPGTCHIADNMGDCVDRPEACIEIYDPVCGCDGRTYSNECHAVMAGVSIDHRGACQPEPAMCGGIAGFRCPSLDQVCLFPPGTCHWPDAAGECVTRPQNCLHVYMPVCGCDGMTYGNDCAALAAGVSVLYEGECRSDAK